MTEVVQHIMVPPHGSWVIYATHFRALTNTLPIHRPCLNGSALPLCIMNAYLLSGQTILVQCRFSDQDQPEMAAHVIVADAHTIHKSMAIYGHQRERGIGGADAGGGDGSETGSVTKRRGIKNRRPVSMPASPRCKGENLRDKGDNNNVVRRLYGGRQEQSLALYICNAFDKSAVKTVRVLTLHLFSF